MSDIVKSLASLHIAAIDARNGYREAMREAEGKGLAPLFSELATLHEKHAATLARHLVELDQKPDNDGSFMTLVHKTIFDLRALFGGLDESVIPGLIDGEQRNVKKYDQALEEPGYDAIQDTLRRHRGGLAAIVEKMSSMKAEN